MNSPDDGHEYVLGHSPAELARLEEQARLVGGMTRRFFEAAGVHAGMRVLDVGCGGGDVTLLVADMIGPTGGVVAVDRAADALVTAQARVEAASISNVSFIRSELAELALDDRFDAAVGRYVLMFQPDPGDVLRNVATHVRPGGVVAFHEVDWQEARSFPPSPLYDKCCAWVVAAMRNSGADTRLAARFGTIFAAAGLPHPNLQLDALVGAGAPAAAPIDLVAGLAATLHDDIVASGEATSDEIGIPTMSARLLAEAAANHSVIVGRSEVGAWAHVP